MRSLFLVGMGFYIAACGATHAGSNASPTNPKANSQAADASRATVASVSHAQGAAPSGAYVSLGNAAVGGNVFGADAENLYTNLAAPENCAAQNGGEGGDLPDAPISCTKYVSGTPLYVFCTKSIVDPENSNTTTYLCQVGADTSLGQLRVPGSIQATDPVGAFNLSNALAPLGGPFTDAGGAFSIGCTQADSKTVPNCNLAVQFITEIALGVDPTWSETVSHVGGTVDSNDLPPERQGWSVQLWNPADEVALYNSLTTAPVKENDPDTGPNNPLVKTLTDGSASISCTEFYPATDSPLFACDIELPGLADTAQFPFDHTYTFGAAGGLPASYRQTTSTNRLSIGCDASGTCTVDVRPF